MLGNYCVFAGCTKTNLSGHCLFRFPDMTKPAKEKKLAFHAWVWFVPMKRRDFTAAPATVRGVVVCDAHFKQKDYHPVMCICINYNLLKNSVSLHISSAERQQAQIVAASADSEVFGSLYELPRASELSPNLWQLVLAALNKQQCSSCLMPNAMM